MPVISMPDESGRGFNLTAISMCDLLVGAAVACAGLWAVIVLTVAA